MILFRHGTLESQVYINDKPRNLMKTTFIEDYLSNPTSAVAKAAQSMEGRWYDEIDEELIYRQISSPEFRLYEEIVFCLSEEENPRQSRYATVA